MEQHNPHGGDPHDQALRPSTPDFEELEATEVMALFEHIDKAVNAGAPISDVTARSIAVVLHDGDGGALHDFAHSGAIADTTALRSEIAFWRQEGPAGMEIWLDAFARYLDHRTDSGPVDGWEQLWPEEVDAGRPPEPSEGASRTAASREAIERAEIPELRADHLNDGWHWMNHLPEGWRAQGSWGRDGWDLGAWPYVVVAVFDHPEQTAFAYATYTEGDVNTVTCESQEELYEAIDDVAEYQWRSNPEVGPDDLPANDGLLPHHRGPFGWQQIEREGDGRRTARPDE